MSHPNTEGRLVLNHSTHIDDLIPVLEELVLYPHIKTVTPGRLARTRSRSTPLKIRVTVPIRGGHKMQARSQGSVQEVFVITELESDQLQRLVDHIIAA